MQDIALPISSYSVIRSPHNQRFKALKNLFNSKGVQKKTGLAILEGLHMAEVAIGANVFVEQWVISEKVLENKNFLHLFEQTTKYFGKEFSSAEGFVILDTKLFSLLSNLETPEGILGVFRPSVRTLPLKIQGNVVVLDALQDPGNTGSILRTAAAVGVKHIIAMPGNVRLWSPKVLRAGMGAHFYLNLYEDWIFDEVVRALPQACFVTASSCTTVEGEKLSPCSIFKSDLRREITWVFGNEGSGVSFEWVNHADYLVTIPHHVFIESLNVASSAAICLFEQKRQQLGRS